MRRSQESSSGHTAERCRFREGRGRRKETTLSDLKFWPDSVLFCSENSFAGTALRPEADQNRIRIGHSRKIGFADLSGVFMGPCGLREAGTHSALSEFSGFVNENEPSVQKNLEEGKKMNDEKERKFGPYGGFASTRENREGSRICREPGSHSKMANPGLCPLDLRYTIRVEFLSGNPGVSAVLPCGTGILCLQDCTSGDGGRTIFPSAC